MPGTLTFVGDVSVGAALPLPAALTLSVGNHGPDIVQAILEAIAQLEANAAALAGSLAVLEGQLKGLLNVSVTLNLTLPDPALIIATLRKAIEHLQKQIEALLTVGITVSSPLPAQIAAILAQISKIQAQVTSTVAQLAAAAAKIAAMLAQLSFLNFQIDLALQLGPALAVAGIDLYRYDGDAGSFGSTVQAALGAGLQGGGGAGLEIHAIVLAARTQAAWSGLQVALRVA